MPCTHQDNTARSYDPRRANTPERSPGEIEAPRPQLTAVQDPVVPAPSFAHEAADRSNRVFNRLVGAGLLLLVALLAAMLFNAGINIEVLP